MKRTVILFSLILALACKPVDQNFRDHANANQELLVGMNKKANDSIKVLNRIIRKETREQKRDSIKEVRSLKAKSETNFQRSFRTATKISIGAGLLLLIQAIDGQ